MEPVLKADLPPNAPPVPRGYKILVEDDKGDGMGRKVYAKAPPDKRKSKGRVPEEPKLFTLLQNQNGKLCWEQEEQAQTIPIRNFMIEQGLRMEIKFPGMRMTAKAPKCSTILRQEFGMQGTPVSLYMQWCRFKGYIPDPKIAEMALAEGEVA